MAPTIWLTGLPASGKTTLGVALVESLRSQGRAAILLDGDVLLRGLCSDLGFSEDDRDENIRRAVGVAQIVADQGMVAVCALVSPMAHHRAHARKHLSAYFEVFVDCPASECARRDPKGLWKAAHQGDIPDFTGVGQRFDVPASPDYHYRSNEQTVADAAHDVLRALTQRGLI